MTRILGRFKSSTVTLAAGTAKELATANPPTPRLKLFVRNTTGADLFVGGSDVTAADGFPIPTGTTQEFDSVGGLYAVSAAGGAVPILEGY